MKRFGLLLLMLLAFPTPALAAEEDSSATFLDFLDWVDTAFSEAVAAIKKVFFFQVGGGVPIIVAWLILGGIYFTLRMGFVNLRGFKHAIQVLLGKYQDKSGVGEEGEGEVSPFQAVSTALSATVGLGSIAGSAIAIQLGGPGAVVWMSLAGFLGMSSKFVECTLGQKYRMVRTDGTIAGGPMYYLSQGLSEMGVPWLGKSLAVLFALLCVGASFGAGNMFQANQSYAAVANVVPYLADRSWLYGFAIALLVGVVIVGGISRIGAVTSNLVPVVVALYIVGCLWIILSNYAEIPIVLTTMLKQAFSAEAIDRNKEPVREGMVASIEPLIDTIIICNLTGMVVVITGVSEISAASGANGIELTAAAFNTVIGWFPVVLAIAVVLFAFSNIIAWSYYGEQAWTYLFGAPSTLAFKALFVIFVFIGTVVNLGAVLDFSDMMLLGMAVPNLLGCFLLSGKVAADLKTYMSKLKLEKMPVPQANSTASDEKSTGRTEN
ncbi:MAG: alanine glycine permease [Cyanobacteria bacterium SW_11_48_12]|nr:MAG: alanine glycine permease [Cyanobacteria bacterium SW_11_48_12]